MLWLPIGSVPCRSFPFESTASCLTAGPSRPACPTAITGMGRVRSDLFPIQSSVAAGVPEPGIEPGPATSGRAPKDKTVTFASARCPFVSRRAPFMPFIRGIEPRMPGCFDQESTGSARGCVGGSAALPRAQRIRASRPRCASRRPAIEAGASSPATLHAVRLAARGGTCRASDEQARVRLSVPAFAAVARLRRAARCCIRPRHPVLSFACPQRASLRWVHTHTSGKRNLQLAIRITPRHGAQNFAASLAGVERAVPQSSWGFAWLAVRPANFCVGGFAVRDPGRFGWLGGATLPAWCVWRIPIRRSPWDWMYMKRSTRSV